MLPCVTISLGRAGGLAAMHTTSTVSHRAVSARLPAPSQVRSASRALVHGQFVHGLVPVISAHHPRVDVADDGLAAFSRRHGTDLNAALRSCEDNGCGTGEFLRCGESRVRISSAAAIFLPVMLTLCSKPSYEARPIYLLNCRLINAGPPIFRQGCKAETRMPERSVVRERPAEHETRD